MGKCEFCGNENDSNEYKDICERCAEVFRFAFRNPNFDIKKMKLKDELETMSVM